MKNVLIICAAGMSSSMIAKKASDHFASQGEDIHVDATTISKGPDIIDQDNYDLYLISPQAKMTFDTMKSRADAMGKPITNIPPQAYVPIPMGIEKLATLIKENL
ncbi:MAG: PTS cellobiose transporter subunit IIB [Aerococcus sp.]|nr:PTS cellobiose transporter subunit IIB [Aerococcus sp.]